MAWAGWMRAVKVLITGAEQRAESREPSSRWRHDISNATAFHTELRISPQNTRIHDFMTNDYVITESPVLLTDTARIVKPIFYFLLSVGQADYRDDMRLYI